MEKVYEGLGILLKYGGDMDAEHDKIWAGKCLHEMDMSEEDIARMKELGWFIDEEYDCWCHFV